MNDVIYDGMNLTQIFRRETSGIVNPDRVVKAAVLLRRLRQRIFGYKGKKEKQADRLMDRCIKILSPVWRLRADNLEARRDMNFMM